MTVTKKILPLVVAAVVATPSVAEISANIGATSNYLWRGLSQTNDAAAISGGIDFEDASGFYAGAWVSNVDFGKKGNETDLYAGFSAVSGDFGYTVGAIYYMYTQHDDSDFVEIHGDVSFGMFSAGLYYTIDAQSDGGEDNIYAYASVGGDLQKDWSIAFTVGHNEPDEGDDYQHVLLELTKSAGDFGDFTFALSQADTGNDTQDDLTPVVSWSKSF